MSEFCNRDVKAGTIRSNFQRAGGFFVEIYGIDSDSVSLQGVFCKIGCGGLGQYVHYVVHCS